MILNNDFIKTHITSDKFETINIAGDKVIEYKPVSYRWTHGATEKHLGDGLLIYTIIQLMRYKSVVCLGSGGGFIPRIMTQARMDLHKQGIFEGDEDYNWGDIGTTYLVDAANGVGGKVSYLDKESYFRYQFCPRFINETTENAYYNFFVKQDIKIDFLHIDAGHSYEDVKQDFNLYSNLLSENGIISIHDTDETFQKELIVTEDEREYYELFDGPPKFIKEIGPEWKQFNFFNTGQLRSKPSSTGITLLQRA
tara:strand:- start:15210 stop:15968 length:759 start_codon:yes stop_codon:yes gene_type:complete